jgi:heme iron utilization protein
MHDALLSRAADLLVRARVATLATVDGGAPVVSMAPYAMDGTDLVFFILVSRLAAHTANMQVDSRVAMLVTEPEPTANAHATPRLSLRGNATALDATGAMHATAKQRYCARFPDMTGLFELGDFGLFAIRPTTLRMVTGFAQAGSIDADALARKMFGRTPA